MPLGKLSALLLLGALMSFSVLPGMGLLCLGGALLMAALNLGLNLMRALTSLLWLLGLLLLTLLLLN